MSGMSDRIFTIAFGASLGVHLFLLVTQIIPWDWTRVIKQHGPIDVIYEYKIAQEELRQLQAQLAQAKRSSVASTSASEPGDRAQVRIPNRPMLTAEQSISDIMPARPSIVDLTNLAEAARGDPVLLSYFSAIREQIQQTANRRSWLTGEAAEGLVYVSFTLSSGGSVDDTAVAAKSTTAQAALREIALRIVRSSAPFPPFPPSIHESSKTIIVPLEFLLGQQ